MRIREVRMQHGISQKELAAAIGIAPNTLSQYENGKRAPDFDTVGRISDYFHVSVDYLLGLGREKPVPEEGDGLSDMEQELIRLFRELNQEGQEQLIDTADTMVSSGKYKKSGAAELGKRQA